MADCIIPLIMSALIIGTLIIGAIIVLELAYFAILLISVAIIVTVEKIKNKIDEWSIDKRY